MRTELLQWYLENRRKLPWRQNRDPYRIWISEVMLQQTTVAAVVPYYEKFMARFPKVDQLANASESEVLEMWAGLGYYSRARNLHKSAKIIAETGFPRNAEELIKLPGFGPYTSNAVASLAFNQAVGVLDGNVIRVLSRVYGLKSQWWLPKEREKLQSLANELANSKENADVNQGLMELGATVCTPKKPLCLLCPWKKVCVARKNDLTESLPLSKPKADGEIWHWQMQVARKDGKIYLVENKATPFLANILFPAGTATRLQKKPKQFSLKHSVTKYDIFVSLVEVKNQKGLGSRNWYPIKEIKKVNPSSLMMKILKKL